MYFICNHSATKPENRGRLHSPLLFPRSVTRSILRKEGIHALAQIRSYVIDRYYKGEFYRHFSYKQSMLSCILVTYLFVSRINGFAIKILNLSNISAIIKNKALISITWHGFCRGGYFSKSPIYQLYGSIEPCNK